MRRTLKSYHFDLGDSSTGPIGFCASVRATSEREAIAILKDALPSEVKVRADDDDERIEYVEVYINVDAIGAASIDEVTDIDAE